MVDQEKLIEAIHEEDMDALAALLRQQAPFTELRRSAAYAQVAKAVAHLFHSVAEMVYQGKLDQKNAQYLRSGIALFFQLVGDNVKEYDRIIDEMKLIEQNQIGGEPTQFAVSDDPL